MSRASWHAEDLAPVGSRYLPAVAFGLCVFCLLAMVPVTFVLLSGAPAGLGYAVPALGAALGVAFVALVVSDR